jgi:hypothetical protein
VATSMSFGRMQPVQAVSADSATTATP